MSAARRLPEPAVAMENAGVPKKPVPMIEEIVSAFAEDRDEVPSMEELDAIYTEAIADGLVTESEMRQAFQRFMDRRLEARHDVVEPAAGPLTVGVMVRRYREARGLGMDELAADRGVSTETIASLEAAETPFDAARVADIARSVARETGAPVRVVNRLLQEARAMSDLKSSDGPMLKAARKAPQE